MEERGGGVLWRMVGALVGLGGVAFLKFPASLFFSLSGGFG